MSKEIIEKLNAIEATQTAEIAKVNEAVEARVTAVKEELNAEFSEKVAQIEAKVSQLGAPAIITLPKSITSDVNKMVKEQLKKFRDTDSRVQKELKMFEDESQYSAYLKEASALTGSGAGIGGRTGYDPVFVALRLANPMRGLSRNVTTDGSSYQFRAKIGNAGAAWGYPIQNNGNPTTQNTSIWQLNLQDLNVQFPIRTAALDDIDGLESNVVSDMMVEFSQSEAISMISNNDQGATSLPGGGSNGLRGLNQYGGANVTYTGGRTSVAAYGTSGTSATSGLHLLATYDQLTSNTNVVGAANVTYKDLVNMMFALPQQYRVPNCTWLVNNVFMAQIRGLVDSNGAPIFNRNEGLSVDGVIGTLLGFDVVENSYVDLPSQSSAAAAGTTPLYPAYFGDFTRGHTIVDRLNMILRRYDQTLPGFITFYGEKRLATSVVDPFAIVRYRSTGTSAALSG